MAKDIVQAIFREKNKLNGLYPYSPNMANFDLERKHLFYGKIDDKGDTVIMDTNFLVGVESAAGSANLLMDFVADAFFSMKVNYRKAVRSGLSRDSIYYKDLKVHKSWSNGSLDFNYTEYIKTLYTNFVDTYLASNRREENIKNMKDFVREFLKYSLRISNYYPLTMSGYITSVHCPTYSSGLVLEIANEEHGVQNNRSIYEYLTDEYYSFWAKHVQKFGFMVDRNAPWRLVFNVASGYKQYQESPDNLAGAHRFMARYGVTYENVFQYRFLKAYKFDLLNLRNVMELLYDQFYKQFSTYEKEEFKLDSQGRCSRVKVQRTRQSRAPLPDSLEAAGMDDEYWLKVLLKLRMRETNYEHDAYSFEAFASDLIERYRLFGLETALKYINGLTKGFAVTKFNMKGGYWQGVTETEYNERRRRALENVSDPNRVQYSLTGNKNIIK